MKDRWTTENIPGLKGKTALITGSNTGIGYEAALAMAGKGAEVILAVRNTGKGEAAASRIKAAHPDADVKVRELDLGSLESVKAFAESFVKDYKSLDFLINNAGVMMPPYGKTKDGFELQWGTNHLGHFSLTGLLMPLLVKTSGARIVNVSSTAHKFGKINLEDLNSESSYDKSRAYGQSKLANLLFTYELQRKLEAAGLDIRVTAAHPGWTVTDLQRHSGTARFLNPVFGQKANMGALPTLRAAIDDSANGGDYFGPGGFMEMRGTPVEVKSNARSHDRDVARRVWEISEESTGVKFQFT